MSSFDNKTSKISINASRENFPHAKRITVTEVSSAKKNKKKQVDQVIHFSLIRFEGKIFSVPAVYGLE